MVNEEENFLSAFFIYIFFPVVSSVVQENASTEQLDTINYYSKAGWVAHWEWESCEKGAKQES